MPFDALLATSIPIISLIKPGVISIPAEMPEEL